MIMTTLAIIVGMLPIALALGEGGGFRTPMARAVIGGLITSTLLTLVVMPVACACLDEFSAWMRGRPRAPAPAESPEAAPGVDGGEPEPGRGR